MANLLRTLQEYGQSVGLDFVSRDLLKSGDLTKLIAEDGLRGVTSNPSIFEKAIGHGDDYDAQIAALQASGDLDPGTLFERLAVTDIQQGADVLRPVYHQTQGRDGYISIEVSPYLAMDTGGTVEEGRRLSPEGPSEKLMGKNPGDDCRGHQHQYHLAVLAAGLRRRRRGVHLGARSVRQKGRRPAQGCKR